MSQDCSCKDGERLCAIKAFEEVGFCSACNDWQCKDGKAHGGFMRLSGNLEGSA